jgi:hypothetical protein
MSSIVRPSERGSRSTPHFASPDRARNRPRARVARSSNRCFFRREFAHSRTRRNRRRARVDARREDDGAKDNALRPWWTRGA